MVTIIACIDNNLGLGYNGNLLYYISEDLKQFKKKTIGNIVIMGRKTYESLSNGALPDRKNIVLTRNTSWSADNIEIFDDINDAISKYQGKDIYIIGGASVYSDAMKYADKLDITYIDSYRKADAFFPEISSDLWKLENKKGPYIDSISGLIYYFMTYSRK